MKKLFLLFLVVCTLGVALGVATLSAEEGMFHGGDIVYDKPLKAVFFSHKFHAEDMGMSCEMCHDGIFQMAARAAQDNEDFTMQGLYDGKYCGACHNGSMAFASNTQCARCHIGVKGFKALTGEDEEKDAKEGHH